MTRTLISTLFVLLATPAFAQFGIPSVVLDPSNLAKNSLTAFQTELMVKQMLVMIERLPGINRYRIPGLPPVLPFVPRALAELARPYLPVVVVPLIASHVQQIDVLDEVWDRAQQRIGAGKMLDEDALGPALDSLIGDITHQDPSRSMTAALDALNASELVARRQGQVSQSLLSSILELEALKAKADRDSAWNDVLMRAAFMAQRDYSAGEGYSDWTQWRQP